MRVVHVESRIDAPSFGVAVLVPSRGFVAEQVDVPSDDLGCIGRSSSSFVLGDIERLPCLGVYRNSRRRTSVRAFSGLRCLAKAALGVRVEVVATKITLSAAAYRVRSISFTSAAQSIFVRRSLIRQPDASLTAVRRT